MIEIDESNFGYWPNAQHSWMFAPHENIGDMGPILEQLYAQSWA